MKAEYLENELIDSYLNGNLKGDSLSLEKTAAKKRARARKKAKKNTSK